MFIAGWRVAIPVGLAVATLCTGGGLLLYATFVRRPFNHPRQFLKEVRGATTGTVVVCVGSSTTHASASGDYVARLRERLGGRGYEFVNAGANGSTSADVVVRLNDVVACRPDAVTILIGINDVRSDTPEREARAAYRDNLEAILDRLRTRTDARIAFLSLQPLGEELDSEINRRVQRFNAVIEDVVARYDAACLPFGERLRALIEESGRPRAPYHFSFKTVLAAGFRRYLGRRSWDQVAARNGYLVHTDGIHLSDRGAGVAAELIAGWLAGPTENTRRVSAGTATQPE